MDRWMEFPPSDFLKKASVWIRLHKLPVNYLTLKTIRAVSNPIGHVKDIEFDPEKPHLQEYIRVRIILDLQQPVRDTKLLNLPNGGSTTVDVEYERVRKKCFHCLRLSHEKQRCPLYQGLKNKSGNACDKGKGIAITPLVHRQHHPDLVGTLMPLLSAPTVPPGFAPRSVVAPEVFEEMQMYMNCTDPEERRLREYKMKKALQDLSSNPGAQSSYLRLEDQPIISGVQNKNVGRVFDFRTAEAEAVGHQNIGEGSNISPLSTHEREININPRADGVRTETHLNENPFMMTMRQPATGEKLQKDIEGAGEFVPSKSGAAFSIGHENHSASGTSGGSKASKRRGTSWKRFKQTPSGARKETQSGLQKNLQDAEETNVKRKAREEMEVSSKMSKQAEGLMVHQKPSNPQ